MALVNAWVLAKVMLVADDLNLGSRWFENRRLIYRILSRSALFALVFMGAHTIEDVVVGWWQGKTILESIPRLGRGSFADILSIGVSKRSAPAWYCAYCSSLDRTSSPVT
jgi:hypothetical protein